MKLTNTYMRIVLSVLVLVAMTLPAYAQTTPDFSGQWKQDNDRCQPKRNGDVALRIEQKGSELTVETSISRNAAQPRHALQTYTTDGKVSVSTGADGDEFHTSATWENANLVLTIEEHEDGRILHSKEIWSLIESGATLQRIRERADGEKQILLYRRQQSGLN